MYDTVGETTGSSWIGACHDAVMGCRVAFCDTDVGGTVVVTTGPCRGVGVACLDADLGGTADVTAGPYCGVGACHDAILEGTVDVATGPIRGEAFRDAVLGGTVGVTTGLCLCVIDTVGVTTSLYLAILRCDATMLFLGGNIVGETTDSLIMSLYSLCRWAIMHCVGSMPW